jgi:hypothetical protein
VVGGIGVGEQVPDDDEDRSGHGDEGSAFAPALDDAGESFAEECVVREAAEAAVLSTPLR